MGSNSAETKIWINFPTIFDKKAMFVENLDRKYPFLIGPVRLLTNLFTVAPLCQFSAVSTVLSIQILLLATPLF